MEVGEPPLLGKKLASSRGTRLGQLGAASQMVRLLRPLPRMRLALAHRCRPALMGFCLPGDRPRRDLPRPHAHPIFLLVALPRRPPNIGDCTMICLARWSVRAAAVVMSTIARASSRDKCPPRNLSDVFTAVGKITACYGWTPPQLPILSSCKYRW